MEMCRKVSLIGCWVANIGSALGTLLQRHHRHPNKVLQQTSNMLQGQSDSSKQLHEAAAAIV